VEASYGFQQLAETEVTRTGYDWKANKWVGVTEAVGTVEGEGFKRIER